MLVHGPVQLPFVINISMVVVNQVGFTEPRRVRAGSARIMLENGHGLKQHSMARATG